MITAGKISLLDDNTINRIAAGEVIERPASVVKELIENSLDAGAKRVVVDLEDGGRKLIRVTDDGHGMTTEEAKLCIQRHATSKIRSAEDLFNIHTLGFRGEGLPSIASVSNLELITQSSDEDAGRKLILHGGNIIEDTPVGISIGTTIAVKDLFFNTPARLKFMKSVATELSHIVDLVSKYAIAYPDTSFRLTHQGNELVSSPGTGDMMGALTNIWGKDSVKELAEINLAWHDVNISGYISPPHLTRSTRNMQTFIVNNRPVRTRTLISALDEAYKSLTPEKRFPIALIIIDIHPEKVDVNVHPAKAEVKFADEREIYVAVHQAVKDALMKKGMIPDMQVPPKDLKPFLQPNHYTHGQGLVQSAINIFSPDSSALPFSQESQLGSLQSDFKPTALPFTELFKSFSIIGQFRNSYIICDTPKGIAIIDQHVAHERVLYEKFSKEKSVRSIVKQQLLTPETLNFDRRGSYIVKENLTEFKDLGFDVEPFGETTFLLRAIPAELSSKSYVQSFKDMVDELVTASILSKKVNAVEQIWITASCKQAVKAGDPLTMDEMDALLSQLAETDNPYLCPHGRPIVVLVSNDEIDRRFKRI